MKMTKELSGVLIEVKCHWSMTTMLSDLVSMHQGDKKTIAVHHERFMNMVDITEGQWESHTQRKLLRMNWTAIVTQHVRQ